MSSNGLAGPGDPVESGTAPDPGTPLTRWQKFRLVVKVVELRLRFVALMAITGLTFAYWDTLWNHYDKWMRPTSDHHVSASGIEYYCPMHPTVVQGEPGKCPICGMPLGKRKKGEQAALPKGVISRVQLAPFRMTQARVKTAEVGYAPMAQTLITVGYVAIDERRLADVSSKVPGKTRVETLYANFTGMDVKKGDPLAELYSPELSQAIAELRTAQRASKGSAGLRTAAARSILGDRRKMVELSSEKLKRWGVTQVQIDEILRQGKDDYKIPILSPITGHLIKKNVVEGQEVQEGYPMFEIVDLSRVWILAQVYEHQVELVREGQTVEASVDALPGRTFPGTVEFVQPQLDPTTRTVEVRFGLENPDHLLRPGMFATVTLNTPVAETPAFQARLNTTPHHHGKTHLASLSVEEQKTCPVTTLKLGSMGDPILVEVEGRKVWTCCEACPPKLNAQPAKYLTRLEPAPVDEVLSVPESAVIDTGRRKIVYIEAEPGVFEGRVVVLGDRVGDRFPVLEGLAPGEKVAAAGTFLIDAESRLNPISAPAHADLDMTTGSDDATRAASAQHPMGHP
ncbi:MAG: efflux RND transporter periplasmic adaptor subunit, partial [Isosphaeraceae bacterium]